MTEGPAASRSVLGRRLQTNRWAQVAELALVFTPPALALGAIGAMDEPSPFVVQAMLGSAGLLMIVLASLGLRLRGESWHHFGVGFRKVDRRRLVAIVSKSFGAFVIALAAFVAGAIVMENIVGTPGQIDVSGYNKLRENWALRILTLLAVYITASFGEEFIYRGFLMTRMAELFGGGRGAWAIALLVSSVIFGLIHYQWGAIGILQTGLMGFGLGVSYLVASRNLWVTILAHAYMDTLLILSV